MQVILRPCVLQGNKHNMLISFHKFVLKLKPNTFILQINKKLCNASSFLVFNVCTL